MILDLDNPIHKLAIECIRGYWGNGIDRYNRLRRAGYNYEEMQEVVNQICRVTRGAK
ncbi:hypothetical protein [Vaginisenegalia massiliensis]|uniref:hypothetical protein n=1 Tax=Vaginisenegalia massiliensis TaxID=2058294 RepID=UPI000F5247E5|nr:hypothetical protein [Vaginisenegalia massiliensis]